MNQQVVKVSIVMHNGCVVECCPLVVIDRVRGLGESSGQVTDNSRVSENRGHVQRSCSVRRHFVLGNRKLPAVQRGLQVSQVSFPGRQMDATDFVLRKVAFVFY